MISAEQIRAGRALLQWSARELADKADVALNTVQRLEVGRVAIAKASVETIDKITRALASEGVVFLEDGFGVTLRRQRNPE
jgi:DNA-binding transcriptional regulator YhcF (GntR family)